MQWMLAGTANAFTNARLQSAMRLVNSNKAACLQRGLSKAATTSPARLDEIKTLNSAQTKRRIGKPMRRFVKPLQSRCRELTLTRLEARVLLIDDVYAATAAHDTAAFFPQFRGFQ